MLNALSAHASVSSLERYVRVLPHDVVNWQAGRDPDRHTTGEVPMDHVGLADLPAHRRIALPKRPPYRDLTVAQLDARVRAAARTGGCCRYVPTATKARGALVAVLGDDGAWHLRQHGRGLVCVDATGTRRGAWHEQRCWWWTNGATYRIQNPPGVYDPATGGVTVGAKGHQVVRWYVKLTDQRAEPTLIPARARCPLHLAAKQWPGYQGPGTDTGRLQKYLADKLGADCHACGILPGAYVDHNHDNGTVRGLLCRSCNAHIDDCLHVTGCPWAEYLNHPPATHLQLTYPTHRTRPTIDPPATLF